MENNNFINKLYSFILCFIPWNYNNPIKVNVPPIIPENNSIQKITALNNNLNSFNSNNSLNSLNSLSSLNEYIRILIIDDSIVFCKIFKHQLEYDGCYVDIITNSEDAYIFLKDNICNYDILVVDIFMPYIYGTSLIKQIRTEIKNNIPIIVLSSIPEFKNEVLDLGANLFFEKGYPINELKNYIANLIS